MEALMEGLMIVLDLGIKKIIIEGNFQVSLNTIRKHNTMRWRINSKLKSSFLLLEKFEETRIQHIYREINKEVDQLTNLRVDGENIFSKILA